MKPGYQQRLAATLKRDLQPAQLLLTLTIGLVAGVLEVAIAIAFCALIYSSVLPDYLGNGISLALAGTSISIVVMALFCTVRGQGSGIQETPAVVTAVMVAALVKTLPPGTASQTAFVSVLALIATTTLLTGLLFLLLGTFRLGGLVRFLPYPVVGGFLAGSGWLLVDGSVDLMGGLEGSQATLRLGATLVLSVAMFVLLLKSNHFLTVPAMLVASSLGFYAVAFAAGQSVDTLISSGWLFRPFTGHSLWTPLLPHDLQSVNWTAIAAQAPNMLTVLALSTLGLLLNCTGLEVELRQQISLNWELRVAGVANLLGGLFSSSLVTHQDLSFTTLAVQRGAASRLVGVTTAATCIAALLGGSSLLPLFPKIVVAAFLAALGLHFLKTWLWDTARQLPRMEYGIILVITIVIATIGLMEGVVVGVAAAVVLFIATSSRTDVVRAELSGKEIRSQVVRTVAQAQILQQNGEARYVLRLQGFIFFGTAERLVGHVRGRLEQSNGPPVKFVLLDFKRVIGLDSTGVASFIKLSQMASERSATIIVADATAAIRRQLERGGLELSNAVRFARDLDQGLEWSEDDALREANMFSIDASPPIRQQLAEQGLSADGADALFPFLVREEVPPGTHLIRQGDAPDCMFFIESGQLTTQLEPPGRAPIRLETFGGGRMVGEIGFFLGAQRTASVVVDSPSVVYRLMSGDMNRLAREHPPAFAALNRLTIQSLSERLTQLNRTVDVLQR